MQNTGTAFERSDKILSIIFGHNDQISDQFAVFNNGKSNSGKIYLPLNVSLESLAKAENSLGFNIQIEVRETKVVLHY